MNWLLKILAAIIVWVVVAVVLSFLGTLLQTVDQAQIQAVGNFLHNAAGLLGFLAGAWFLIWGTLPASMTTRA